jgi:hypothetical protein
LDNSQSVVEWGKEWIGKKRNTLKEEAPCPVNVRGETLEAGRVLGDGARGKRGLSLEGLHGL